LRVRDAYGDRVREGGIAPAHFQDDNSTVKILLPPSKWYIGLTQDESKGWTETSVSVNKSASQTPIEIYLDLNRGATPLQTLQYQDQAAAKKELKKRGYQFTGEDYIERARKCNTEDVDLFLQAGMPLNTLDN